MYIDVNKEKINYLQVTLIVLGLLGYEMISFLPGWFKMDSRLFSVPYRGFFLILCIYAMLTLWPVKKYKPGSFMLFVIVFWMLYFSRLLYDSFFTTYQFGRPIEEYWLYTVCLGFLPMFAYLIPLTNATLRKAMYYSFYVAAIVNLLGFYSNMQFNALSTSRLEGNEFLNPGTYGQLGAMQVIFGICIFSQPGVKRSHFFTSFIIFTMVVGLANIALSGSRGPLLQMVIALLLFAFYKLKRKYFGYVILTTSILLVIGIIANNSLQIFDVLIQRLNSTGDGNNISDNQRLQMVSNAWNSFLDSPLVGAAFEEKQFHMYPHNLIVEACMATGIVGGLLILVIYLFSFKNSIGLFRNNSQSWIGLLCIVSLITGLTTGGLWAYFKFWTLVALVDNLRRNNQEEARWHRLNTVYN
jgi:hypothetical protein